MTRSDTQQLGPGVSLRQHCGEAVSGHVCAARNAAADEQKRRRSRALALFSPARRLAML